MKFPPYNPVLARSRPGGERKKTTTYYYCETDDPSRLASPLSKQKEPTPIPALRTPFCRQATENSNSIQDIDPGFFFLM